LSLRLVGALSVHRLEVLDPAIETTIAFHQLISNTPDFVNDYIASHGLRLCSFAPALP